LFGKAAHALLLAYYLHDLGPFLIQFNEHLGIRWYGLAYVLAFLCGGLLYRYLAQKGYSELDPHRVSDFITWGAIFGVVLGGRLGYVLFYGLDRYLQHPIDIFKVTDGGMSSHGGIIGLVLFTWWYARRHKLSWLGIGDNLVVVAPIGLFFGRLANFINGELFGRPATVPWAMQFPAELSDPPSHELIRNDPVVRERLHEILTPRHPSQLYEAFLEGIVLFAILWVMRTRMRVPRGVLTGTFFVCYAILRMIGEIFREPDAPLTAGLTRGQFLSVFMIIGGILFILAGLKIREFERANR
jgi:phosphatidylglycerol:prolipoprotein diacylglycerol transferase